jgi:H+/Cl- antiporter ClcA
MKTVIWKQVAFENVFAVGMVAVSVFILYTSLKYGIAFGGWRGKICKREEQPFLYRFCVAFYVLFLVCSLFMLTIVIRADIAAAAS